MFRLFLFQEYSDQNYKHYDHSLIDRGVCVQKTCSKYGSNLNTTLDLSRSLEVCLDESLKREYGLSARLSTLFYCDQYNESRHFDGWDWAVLIGILGIVIISIIGSFYDYNLSKDSTKTLENGESCIKTSQFFISSCNRSQSFIFMYFYRKRISC